MGSTTLTSPTAAVSVDLRVGHLREFSVTHQGRVMRPLHTAEWVDRDDIEIPDHLCNVERYLSGDFLCAPFAECDIEPGPFHGWPANSAWDCVERTARNDARFVLRKRVLGATVEKHLRCAPDSPLLYQTHRFVGGHGTVPVAHHAMVRMQDGGRIFCSHKSLALTPDHPTESGLNHLDYPAETTDIARFPSDSGPVDLTSYPIANDHEDFVVLVEEDTYGLGWTAVFRQAEDDIVFVLKDPSVLPVTMLWYSNGGLTIPPWNGNNRGVLGIEDGRSGMHCGHSASLKPNRLTDLGIPTALELDSTASRTLRTAIGAVPCPNGWDRLTGITLDQDILTLIGPRSETVKLPFDVGFFDGGKEVKTWR